MHLCRLSARGAAPVALPWMCSAKPVRLLYPTRVIQTSQARQFSSTETAIDHSAAQASEAESTQDSDGSTEIDKAKQKESELVPGKPYRNIDTTVKALQHMTDEDLSAPDKQMVAADMKDLILEARDKIKPVIQAMPEEELRSLIMTLDEAKKDH